MRIAFINPQGNFDTNDSYLTEHPDFGGQLVYVKEICRSLSKLGVEVDIVTRLIDDPKWSGFDKALDYFADEKNPRIIRIECGGASFLEKESLWPYLPEFVNNLLDFYGEDLPDFLTSHYADAGYCAVLLQNKCKRGFTFTGHSLGAQKLDKLNTTLENFSQIDTRFKFSKRIAAERLSMQHAFKIITSTFQERMEQYSHPLYKNAVDPHDDHKFAVIPPGVNTDIFCAAQDNNDKNVIDKLEKAFSHHKSPYLIVSSRLDHKKNIIALVKAYANSKPLQSKSRLALFIRGVTDPFADISTLSKEEQAVLQPILDIINQAKIKDLVDFIDVRSQTELATAYRFFAQRNSVFILPSLYEPFGLAPIEAGACGLAVAATKNGGPSEIFKADKEVLFEPTLPNDVAEKCLYAIEHASDLAKNVQILVNEKYTWMQTAKAYLSVLNEGTKQTPADIGNVPTELNACEEITKYLSNE